MTAPAMTLRRCALPSCYRRFPTLVSSPQVFCDDECRETFLLLLEVRKSSVTENATAPTPPTPPTPPLTAAARPHGPLDPWSQRR